MDRLPNELIDRISSHLSFNSLKNTLLLSRAFRFSAERYSAAFAEFTLNETTAEKFIDIFSGHRLLYLRDLQFGIRLPLPEHKDRRDNAEQLRKHDESFTQQIMFLFKTLKTVEEHAGNQKRPGRVRLVIAPPWRPIFRGRSLSYHDHLSWRVRLLEPEALPLLESVRSLEVGGECDTSWNSRADGGDYKPARVKLDYRVMVDLVKKLPNLEYWGCRVGGDEWSTKTNQEATKYLTQEWAGPRRDARQDFANSLLSAPLPGSLQHIRLDFLYDLDQITEIDHLTEQPDLVSPAANDLFSTSLHHLSHHLRRIHLRLVADETLFWPKDGCIPSWPNLESLAVMFHMVSPSGKWYFIGPNGEGRDTAAYKITDASYPPLETTPYDEEMDWQLDLSGDRRFMGSQDNRIRIVPNNTTLWPFLTAFAKATSNMKALQEAVLWCPLAWAPEDEDSEEESDPDWISENCRNTDRLAWGVHYQARHKPKMTEQNENLPTDVPLLWWKVGKWRPDPELHGLFQQIGRIPQGNGLEERWEDEVYGGALVGRAYFEHCMQEDADRIGRILPPN